MHRLLAIAVLVLVPSAALAGGGGHDLDLCRGFSEGDTVVLRDFCLDGVAHFTEPGTVVVRNAGQQPHDYSDVGGAFGTGLLQPGDEARIAVDPGVYRVRCTLHSSPDGDGMAGGLVVGEAPAPEPMAASGSGLPWAPLGLLAVGLAALGAQRLRALRSAAASTS